jgi:hypothetical protein
VFLFMWECCREMQNRQKFFNRFLAVGNIKLSLKKKNKRWRFYLPLPSSKWLSIQFRVSQRLLGARKYLMRHYI